LHWVWNRPPGLGEPETTSIPAARAYYEGLALQTSGDVAAAKSRFEEAAQLDPLYAKPRYSLEESWQLLKDFRTLRQQREVNALWRKADSLRRRLAADPFVTDSDAIMAAYTTGTTPQDDPAFGACPTPAVCLWNLQITYWEIGSLSKNYFDDTSTEEATLREIVRLADEGEAAWPEDEWIPEILYWQILAHRWLKNWEEVRTGCERIFVEWPDFRMAWALEDMYETALQKLGG
jgi:tetratricopeptide (TPR) repeat protein